MSLIGNLEDLPLSDILQIINLSHRTGLLRLRVATGQVWVAFRDGCIVAAGTPTRSGRIDDLLVEHRLMGREQAAAALRGFPADGSVDPAAFLIENTDVDAEALRAVQSREIQTTIGELFGFDSGNFSFELIEEATLLGNARRSGRWIHTEGISPQHLLIEATRQVDEAVRGLGEPPVPEPPAAPEDPVPGPGEGPPAKPARRRASVGGPQTQSDPPEATRVLILDDEALYRSRLAAELESEGFRVSTASGATEALGICTEWTEGGSKPIVIVDLLMPDSSGEGFLGGIEFTRLLMQDGIQARVIGLCAGRQDEYRQETQGLPIEALVSKPDLTATPLGALPAAIQDLAHTLVWQIRSGPRRSNADPDDPLAGLEPGTSSGSSGRRVTDPVGFLRGLMGELRQPENPSEAWILVLRVASEFLERAVLFVRRRHRYVAFGGFGPTGEESNVETNVSKLSFDADENPLLVATASDRTLRIGSPEEEPGAMPIVEALGPLRPTQYGLMPLVAAGQVIALLYVDNAKGRTPLPDLRSLEIFLVQLGLSLENAALQQRVNASPVAG
ncbi:MAG: DUF4388 domain-containing protein [Acidobacteriota bacterium]